MATPLFKDEFIRLLEKHLPESDDAKAVIIAAAESLILDDDTREFIGSDPIHTDNMKRALRQWKKHQGIDKAEIADVDDHYTLDILIDFLLDRNGLNIMSKMIKKLSDIHAIMEKPGEIDLESTVPVMLTPSDALNIRILSNINED